MFSFHLLVWNRDHLEPAQKNAGRDGCLKVAKDVSRAFAPTGGPKWTKFQPPASMGAIGGKPVRIELVIAREQLPLAPEAVR